MRHMISSAVIDLARDLSLNQLGNYSVEEGNDVLRKAIKEELGIEKWDGRAFRYNKDRIYEIVERTLDVAQPQTMKDVFGQYVDTQFVGWSQTAEFNIPPSRQLFQVATVSYGNGSVRKQELEVGGKLQVPTALRHITIRASWYEFVSGQIDWVRMITQMNDSFVHQIRMEIYDLVHIMNQYLIK